MLMGNAVFKARVKKAGRSVVFLLSLGFGDHLKAQSQEALMDCQHTTCLSEIKVITATKNPRKLADVPVRTEIITAAELKKTHARTLDDALKYTSGIVIKPIGNNAEKGAGVSIQGLDPSQVLILIDGNPVAPNSGEMLDTVDVSQILMNDVDRIEIIKGGASALYGANAMGGVVNIITQNPDKPFSFSADVSAGHWGDKSVQQPLGKDNTLLSASTKQGPFSAQLVANFLNQQGYDSEPDKQGSDGWHGYKNNFSTKLQYAVNPSLNLTLAPSFYRAQTATDKQGQDIYKTLRENKMISERDTWNVGLDGQLKELTYQLNLMDQTYEELIEEVSSRLEQSNRVKTFNLKMNKPLGESHLVNLTLDRKNEFLSQYDLAKQIYEVEGKSKNSMDLALSDSWFVSEHLEVMPAVRVNDDEFYGVKVSPMLSLMYANKSWIDGRVNIRASIAEGYKTPSLKQMYWVFDHGSLWYFGNPDLKPESSLSSQLGVEFLADADTRFEINLFNNDIQNLIDVESDPEKAKQIGAASVFVYANVDKARTRGVETSFKKSYHHLAFQGAYTYLEAINLETGKALPQRSKHQIQLGVDVFNFADARLSFLYRYYSKQYVDFSNDGYIDDYDLIDIKYNQNLTKSFAWYLGIDNLLDKNPGQASILGAGHGITESDAFTYVPRYMYAGIRYKL